VDLKKYFRQKEGSGYLATAGRDGEVNIAVYSRPHVLKDGTLAFGMTSRLTHANLQENPHAVYAFKEEGFRGRRMYLEKVREETGGSLLQEIRARVNDIVWPGAGADITHVVYFKVVKNLPLVGA
jgi:hypothetical protein